MPFLGPSLLLVSTYLPPQERNEGPYGRCPREPELAGAGTRAWSGEDSLHLKGLGVLQHCLEAAIFLSGGHHSLQGSQVKALSDQGPVKFKALQFPTSSPSHPTLNSLLQPFSAGEQGPVVWSLGLSYCCTLRLILLSLSIIRHPLTHHSRQLITTFSGIFPYPFPQATEKWKY